MEIKEKTILELILGLVFISFLVVIVLLVVYISPQAKVVSSTPVVVSASPSVTNIVSNSYNNISTSVMHQTVIVHPEFDREDIYRKTDGFDRSHKVYSSYGEHTQEKTYFNNYKDEFRVHVVNKEYTGRYFKVKFGFCDYYDNCFSETIEKYIPAREEVDFVYLDVQSERYKYYNWEYIIIPED